MCVENWRNPDEEPSCHERASRIGACGDAGACGLWRGSTLRRTPQSAGSPSATPEPVISQTVTLADDGRTITLHVGDSFLLKLEEGYTWTPSVGDESIISRDRGITVVQGAQGVYEALKVGETILVADGDPTCRQSKPPCMRPSRRFQIQIVVE